MVKRSLICLIFLLCSTGFSAQEPAAMKARITDSQNELLTLKSAIEKLYRSTCADVEKNSSGQYSLDTSSCLPSKLSSVIGKQALIGGPNCYNFALVSLGVLDVLRPVNSEELEDLYLAKSSPFCRRNNGTRPSEAGDFVSLEERINSKGSRKLHAYVYLTKKYVLTKNGPDTESRWEIAQLASVLATYPVAKEELILASYTCGYSASMVPADIKPVLLAISSFSKFMSAVQLKTTLSSQTLQQTTQQIESLTTQLTQPTLQVLYKNRNVPEVRLKLYELVSQFYAVKSLQSLAEKTSESNGKLFLKSAVAYLQMMDRILDLGDETFGLKEVVNPESSVEYEYCNLKNQTPKLCQLGS